MKTLPYPILHQTKPYYYAKLCFYNSNLLSVTQLCLLLVNCLIKFKMLKKKKVFPFQNSSQITHPEESLDALPLLVPDGHHGVGVVGGQPLLRVLVPVDVGGVATSFQLVKFM